MTPNEVREWILAEHAALRSILEEIDDVLNEGATSGLPAGRLHRLTERLKIALEHHLDLEDSHLVPLIGSVDAFGPDHAAQVASEHDRQRNEIEALPSQFVGPAVDATLARLSAFVGEIRRDMDLEERTLLGPDVLRPARITLEQLDTEP